MRKSLLAAAALVAAAVPAGAAADSTRNTYICITYTYVYVGSVRVPTVRQVSITDYPYCDLNIPLPGPVEELPGSLLAD